jgi:hypothetical protein
MQQLISNACKPLLLVETAVSAHTPKISNQLMSLLHNLILNIILSQKLDTYIFIYFTKSWPNFWSVGEKKMVCMLQVILTSSSN